MIDRYFSAALTFCTLAAGTLAIGSEMFGLNPAKTPSRQMQIVQLPLVQVIVRRTDATRVAKTDRAEPAAARIATGPDHI